MLASQFLGSYVHFQAIKSFRTVLKIIVIVNQAMCLYCLCRYVSCFSAQSCGPFVCRHSDSIYCHAAAWRSAAWTANWRTPRRWQYCSAVLHFVWFRFRTLCFWNGIRSFFYVSLGFHYVLQFDLMSVTSPSYGCRQKVHEIIFLSEPYIY